MSFVSLFLTRQKPMKGSSCVVSFYADDNILLLLLLFRVELSLKQVQIAHSIGDFLPWDLCFFWTNNISLCLQRWNEVHKQCCVSSVFQEKDWVMEAEYSSWTQHRSLVFSVVQSPEREPSVCQCRFWIQWNFNPMLNCSIRQIFQAPLVVSWQMLSH